MKSFKLVLIVAILVGAMVNFANADGFKVKPKKCVKITYIRAIHKPGLVADMHEQLNPKFLNKVEPLYVVEVVHNNVLYKILGSRQQWISFFKGKIYGQKHESLLAP